MAKTRAQKEEVLTSLLDALKADPQIAIFTAQTGITVKDTEEIRNAQKEKGSKVMMVKKTLLNKALSEQGMEASLDQGRGLVSIVLNYDDAITPTKIISKFKSDNEGIEILGGIYEGKVVGPEVIMQLSTLPTFEEAMAKFMCAMQAVGNKFAATVEALRVKKESESSSDAEGEILNQVQNDTAAAPVEEAKEEAPAEKAKEAVEEKEPEVPEVSEGTEKAPEEAEGAEKAE